MIAGDYSVQPTAGHNTQVANECDQGCEGNNCNVQGSGGGVHQHVSGQSACLMGQQVLSLSQATW